MSLSPQQRYEQDIQRHGFILDPAQADAVVALQLLYRDLIDTSDRRGSWLSRFWPVKSKPEPLRGLYFWGGVGRGKTYLMDNFFESLPFDDKVRAHFHRFMRMVHEELTSLKGEKNPLEKVADRIASRARVICFDEFFVSDITDAMILGTLLQHLFARGVLLVATSNIVPDDLYRDGLQRQRFLPAIALLNKHCRVINVDGGTDYRLRALQKAEIYHYPLDSEAERSLASAFTSLVPAEEEITRNTSVEIEGRSIACRSVAEDVIWFEFLALCDGPRSQNDYIEIAREFHAVLVSNVRAMTGSQDDLARRFINMVDEFYDRNVKLILSADVAIEALYSGSRLAFEFQRTVSRLLEMQSTEYLARPHKP